MAFEFIVDTILEPVISSVTSSIFGSGTDEDDKGESGFVDKDTNIRTRRIERLSRERAIREGVKNRMEGLPTIPVSRAADTRGKYKGIINEAFAKAADNNRIDMVISAYLAQRKKHNLDNTYGSAVSITDPYSDVSYESNMEKKLNKPQGNFDPDVFGAAIPGQSLTANPGQFPYEKPPITVDPAQAIDAIVESIRKPHIASSYAKLLEAGLSAETIASGLTLIGVSEGAFDPDVAEMIKPALVFYIVEIGYDHNVEDINVLDDFPDKGMSTNDGLELLEMTSPNERLPKKIEQLR